MYSSLFLEYLSKLDKQSFILHQGPILLTWINLNPNMDK